ncbi:hypothetical protein E2C01_014215 [Portunus trituberculatus]|uniref:Uncharacterized protein n=1 Tax=Portunus trituberculatus TaxID=210409 RepID=A0A5B7DJ70_PORTR|nr:hypothetical protein [Portunus trituberculatus]
MGDASVSEPCKGHRGGGEEQGTMDSRRDVPLPSSSPDECNRNTATLTIATVALNDLEDSLHMSVRPSGGGFPGSACMYSSHNTGSVTGGSSEGLLADYR